MSLNEFLALQDDESLDPNWLDQVIENEGANDKQYFITLVWSSLDFYNCVTYDIEVA